MEHSEQGADGERHEDAADPLPLEPVVELRAACPECGASWRGDPAEPCMRCGYDPRPPAPAPGLGSSPGAESDRDPVVPIPGGETLPRPRVLGRWLWGIGLSALLVNAIGALAGAPGLLGAAEVVDWPDRIEAFARGPLLVGLWGVSGFLALATVGWLRARPLGDPLVGLGRMLAIVAVCRVAAFITTPWPIVEFGAEALVQSAGFSLGVWMLFRLELRDILVTLGLTIGSFTVLYAAAHLVTWIAA